MSSRALQELIDKQAITERLYEYCRSMDRLDEELGKGCFHPDAEADYGETVFQGTGHGFVEMCMKAHPIFHAHSHQIANILIWLDGPEKARSEAYVDATLRKIDGEGQATDIRNLGRYIDCCRNIADLQAEIQADLVAAAQRHAVAAPYRQDGGAVILLHENSLKVLSRTCGPRGERQDSGNGN